MADTAIPPSAFQFLRALKRNNDRVWFNANKDRYVAELRDPLLAFIAAFAPKLAKLNRHLIADPSPNGGSLFRIYRDTRFAKDKSPYKTHAGMYFAPPGGRESPAPGFYLHVEPGNVFMAGGLWHPDPVNLKRVRDAIATKPGPWKKASRSKAAPLDAGEALSRPPRGYDPEHPLIDDLKRKSFTTSHEFSEAQASAPDFADRYAAACRDAVPLLKFLSAAVGVPW
jgi:uncharacterized protein (TIGR02453 family)